MSTKVDRLLDEGELVPYIDALFAEYGAIPDEARWRKARLEVIAMTENRWKPSVEFLKDTYNKIKNGEWVA